MQEFGEGVDRMYREMEKAGLPAPEYKDVAFMLNATIRNCTDAIFGTSGATSGSNTAKNAAPKGISKNELLVYHFVKANPEASTRLIADSIRLSTRTVQRCIAVLIEKRMIENQGTRQHVKWSILEQRR